MFSKRKPQVLVVGAGPVGLTTALALTRTGTRVRIVDQGWRTGTRSYALALHAGTLRLLEELDVLADVLRVALRVRRVGIFDREGRLGEMRISDLPEDHSFVAVLRQEDFEKLVAEALQKAGTKVEWNRQVSRVALRDDGATVTIDKLDQDSVGYVVEHTEWVVASSKDFDIPFVIGADGHRSTVRRELGIEFRRIHAPQDFAVFEFRTDEDLGDEMRLAFAGDTTNVCWPLPGGFCRWSFQVPGVDTIADLREKDRDLIDLGHERFPELTEKRLRELLRERAPWFHGSIESIRWRLIVRFESRLAERFGRGKVWLAGDAAHVTGPAGVQSMNVGLREACDLARAVAQVAGGAATEDVLEAYDTARQVEWRRLLAVEGGLEPKSDAPPWARELKDRLLPCIPASGRDLQQLAEQIGLRAPSLTAHPA